jgi:2-polyprenyl-3-methyl-5-hydroxy-6-metoxy-1,4-benzoquinol methylase
LSEAFLYSGAGVDISSHDLPALKAEFIVEHVDDGSTVVDIGCGGGKMLRTINEHRRGVTLMGCDVKTPAETNGDFIFAPIDPSTGRLPYDDASVDVVLVIDVFEHVERPEVMLSEIARILRPTGTLVAFVPMEGKRISWYSAFRRILGKDLYKRTKGHVQAFRHDEFDRMLGVEFVVRERRYIYHLLGQLMDAALCAALSVDWVRRAFWSHSPYHGSDVKPSGSVIGRLVSVTFKAANAAAWAESRTLRNVRATSTGVLFVAGLRSPSSAAL